MITGLNTANIFSKLASNSSLLPMGIKDGAHTAGMTTASYITGKDVEGKDRLIDEAGTALIWIGGIPFYKKIIDFAVKMAGFDPKIDVRLLENKGKEILEKAKNHSATDVIESAIKKAESHKTLFQGIALGKFVASTVLTLGSYWALTNLRHKHTEKNIIKQIKKEEAAKKLKTENEAKNNSKTPALKQNNPSFGMNLDINALKSFMFNPVNNMKIVDGGITAERLSESRNPQDFLGYVVKEGAFWGLMYYAGDMIQNHFIKKAAEKGHPIDLDIKVLQDKDFQKAIKTGELRQALDAFPNAKNSEEIYDALFKQFKPTEKEIKGTMSDNLVVKMAEKSGIITTIKDQENLIDTRCFIDIDAVKKLKDHLTTFLDKAPKNTNGDKAIEAFLDKAVSLKRSAVLKNIGITSFALGVVVPGIMLAMRYSNKDNKEFAVKKQIHEKLKQNNLV